MFDEDNYLFVLSDRMIDLTKKENKILKTLIENQDRFVSLKELCYNIYEETDLEFLQYTVRKIYYLRKKIKPEYQIINKNRIGYKIRYKGTR